jgi:hypothetical protein
VLGLLLLITGLYALFSVLFVEEMLRQETVIAGDGDFMVYGLLLLIISGLQWSAMFGSMHSTYALFGPLVNLSLLLGLLWVRDRRHARALSGALVTMSSRSVSPPVRGWRRMTRHTSRSL